MKKLIPYIVLTFTLTYLSHGLLAFLTTYDHIEFQGLPGQVLFIAGGSSPTLFALFFILRDPKLKETFKERLLSVRHSPFLWLFALGVPLLIGGTYQLLSIALRDTVFESSVPFYAFFMILFVSVLFGGLEEIGWRGFVQERVMNRYKPIVVAIGIGILWGLWHVPLFWIEEVSHYDYAFLPFLLGAIMFSTYLTWLYRVTGSLILVVLFHASINASATIGLHLGFDNSFFSILVIVLLTCVGLGLLVHEQKKDQARIQPNRT